MLKITHRIESGEQLKIIFFGDSVTQGCFEDTKQPGVSVMDTKAVYHNCLKNKINEKYPEGVRTLFWT